MKKPKQLSFLVSCILFFSLLTIPARAEKAPGTDHSLGTIFEEAKGKFFATIAEILKNHPMKSDLSEKELSRVLNAKSEIPFLFERLMIVAYQKDAPLFSEWIKRADKESLEKFKVKFEQLALDYAARFVGSLFRRTRLFEFESSLPHNKGKTRLELVLQSIGYNARNDLPDIPKEKWFSNVIETDYYSQWTIDAVNARKCWSRTRGTGVLVAVIDSGIDPYNSLFKDRIVPGFSFLDRKTPPWSQENPPMIDYGLHGTGVSSVILAMAPDCRVLPVRVNDSDTMNDPVYDYWIFEFMAAGIYYAVNHGAQVISCSAALPATELPLADAVRYAFKNNVVVCSSAGNISRVQLGLRLEDMIYKAMDKEVILVGGVEKAEGHILPWPVTVPNPLIDVSAPSADVFIVVPVYMKELKNMPVAGTSLSAPIAAGVAALMRSFAPPAESLLKTPGGYVRLISRCLRETARLDVLGLSEPDEFVGRGLIDADAAVQMIQRLMNEKK